MKTFRSLEEYSETGPCVVSVGNFDGVHRGHSELVRKVVQRAQRGGKLAVIVTFDPHTRAVVSPGARLPILSTFEEKAVLLERLGVDCLVRVPFDQAFRRLTAKEFARSILKERLNASDWVMGSGHTFGRDAGGSKNSLHEVVSRNDIRTFSIDLQLLDDQIVSSTEIRGLVAAGELDRAVGMLGHPYLIEVQRVAGLKIGTRMGVPTLNFVHPQADKVVPPAGVYTAHLQHEGSEFPGALYFGDCPTFAGREIHFEFHLLSPIANEPKVGGRAFLWVHQFVRPDKAFADQDSLVRQIHQDISTVKQYFVQE